MKASKLFSFHSSLIVVATSVLTLTSPFASAGTETFNTAGDFSWTCPTGVTSIQVECWGGGGAGGAGTKAVNTATNTSQNGGGGGGGAYARRASVPVTPGLTYTFTIPAAAVSGTNGTTTNGQGRVNGGAVTFTGDSAVTVTANGGTGGACAYTTANSTIAVGGGAGGTAVAGDTGSTFSGGAGAASTTGTSGTRTNRSGGGGGGAGDANPGGNADEKFAGVGGIVGGGAGGDGRGDGNVDEGAGGNGMAPGGGGGGAKNLGLGTNLGGTGGLGQIIITIDDSPLIAKANNSDDLNLTTSWMGGVVPDSTVRAKWDGTVGGANTTILGADVTWGGMQIVNPGGLVTINAGNTLTLGAAGIDIDLTTATQDLTMNNNLAMGAANVWDVAGGRTLTLGGVVSGTASVIKQGNGTAILTGNNTYTGATTVSVGTLVAAGGSASTGLITVGSRVGNAVLNVPSGGTQTGSTSLTAGTVSGSFGAVNITGGTLTTTADSDSSAFGATDGGYGAFTMSSGTLNQPRFMFGGIGGTTTGGAVGVGLITGGTVNTTNWMILARNAASTGILTITGGMIDRSAAINTISIGLSGTGRAELNVAGGTIDNTGRNVTFSGGTTGSFHWSGTGLLNLNAGTLATNAIVYDANVASANASSYVNFNGGTLKSTVASASFLPAFTPTGSGINKVFVNGAFGTFVGGATIDTNGFNSTISADLLAPTGNGVTSLSLDAQGAGYIGAPAVKILDDGLPSTATAYAVVDTDSSSATFGKVTGVVITNPGVIAGIPSVDLVGGGGSGAAVSVASLGANSAGGLTKIGGGTLTLSGANTYTGATLVSTGTLKSSTAGSAMTDITVVGGAAKAVLVAATDGQWLNTGDLTLHNNSAVVIDYDSSTPSTTVAPIAVDNLVPGTNLGLKFETATFSGLNGLTVGQIYPLITWTTSGPSDGSAFTLLTPRLAGTLTVAGKTLILGVTSNAAGLPISWNAGDGTWDTVATNWVDSNLAVTAYIDPSDGVLFGDAAGAIGNPTITLDSVVSPSGGVTMNSTSHDYTITGSGGIGGAAGLTLAATNTKTLTLATANTYTGGTVINGGTLKLSGAGTPGAVGSAVAVSSGALLDLNGTNQAITFTTATTGVGTVANNSGSGTSTLTLTGTPTINGSLVTIVDSTTTPGGKVAVVITGNTQPMSNANTYSGGTTVNAGAFLYLNSSSPLGAGSGPITLTALGANGAASSGLVLDGASYANDITGAGYVHNNANSGATVVTTTLTGNLNTSGPFIFRAGTGIVYDFAGNGTTSTLSGVIGSTTSMVNGAVATGSIIKSGTGTLTLSGANLYSGSTTVTAGTLSLTGNRTATTGAITVGNLNGSSGTLNVSNGTFQTGTVAVGAGDGTAVGIINQTGGTLTVTGTQLILGNGGIAGTLAGNGGNGTYNLSGGTLTATAVANRGVMLGTNDGGTSTFNLSGTGMLTLTGVSQLMVGRSDTPVTNTTNVFNQTGGTASVTILSIGGAAAAATGLNSTFTVTGGTFSATSFTAMGVGDSGIVTINIGGTADVTLPAFPTARGIGTTATITFDGGTLKPAAASATYLGGLTNAFIKAGGAKFDTTNGSITIAQSLLVDSSSGGLTKDGINTLTLTGANTYTGNTSVAAGTLALADNAQLKFVLGAASGVNNSISGAGTVTLAGDFVIDTSAADALSSGTWTLENVATLAGPYGATFSVVGFTDAGGDKWTKANGATKIYTFDETTGILTLASTDAYAAWALAKGLDGTAGHEAGKSDDPDNDGKNNLYEFAFDGNPLSGANDGKIVGKVATVGGNQVMTLTVPVRTGATFAVSSGDQLSAPIDGIYYRVEGDGTLSPFADSITEVTTGDETAIQTGLPALSTGWTYRTFRAPGTVATVPKAFLRAMISATP